MFVSFHLTIVTFTMCKIPLTPEADFIDFIDHLQLGGQACTCFALDLHLFAPGLHGHKWPCVV